jgi:formylglycine-generating enzyme required for sulfatase activity
MHGNVLEWCQGTYHDSWKGGPTDGSAWVEGGDPRLRICRGGAWTSLAPDCRSGNRFAVDVYDEPVNVGLRIAMRVEQNRER